MNPSLSLRHNRYSSWYNVLLTVTSNVDNLNLYNYITTNSPWTNTSKKLRAIITIAPGVRVSSASIVTPALTVPTNGASSFRDYDLVIINNQGTIAGASGAGGVGVAGGNGSNGGPGGTALNIQRSRVFLNNTGIIGGGGGGGGAGGGSSGTSSVLQYFWATGIGGYNCENSGNYNSLCGPVGFAQPGCFGSSNSIACCGACYSGILGSKCTYGGANCWYCAQCSSQTVNTTVYYAGGTGGNGEGKLLATNGSGGEGTAAVGGDGGTLGQTGEDGTDSTTFSGGDGGAPGNWINGFGNLTVQFQGIVYGGSA